MKKVILIQSILVLERRKQKFRYARQMSAEGAQLISIKDSKEVRNQREKLRKSITLQGSTLMLL